MTRKQISLAMWHNAGFEVPNLLHGMERHVFGNAGYTGAQKWASKRGLKLWVAVKRSVVTAVEDAVVRDHRAVGVHQGLDPRGGGASVPGIQTAVRLREGALQRTGEEPRACDDAARASQSVNGVQDVAAINIGVVRPQRPRGLSAE